MRRKASTSFRGHPHSRLNLSPNPALRLFDILAGPPDFGSRTISFRTSSDILASASSAWRSHLLSAAALGLPGSLENPRGVRPLAPRSAKMRSLSSFEYIRTSLIEVQESAALPLRI